MNKNEAPTHEVRLTITDLSVIADVLKYAMNSGRGRDATARPYHLPQTLARVERRISRLDERKKGQF